MNLACTLQPMLVEGLLAIKILKQPSASVKPVTYQGSRGLLSSPALRKKSWQLVL